MIFVTVGSSRQPFDRLLRGIANLQNGVDAIIVQSGASTVVPAGVTCVRFLAYDELLEHMTRASAVVTHAGVGSILCSQLAGKTPFVVPRRREFGEAVDDHQLELALRLNDAGLVRLVLDPADLPEALTEEPPRAPTSEARENRLVLDLRAYLAKQVTPRDRFRTP